MQTWLLAHEDTAQSPPCLSASSFQPKYDVKSMPDETMKKSENQLKGNFPNPFDLDV